MKQKLAITTFIFFIFSNGLFSKPVFEVSDRIEVLDPKTKKNYSAIILKIQPDGYLVHYDGYSDSYDEVVSVDRVKEMAQIPGVAFVKSEKKKKKEKKRKKNLRSIS